MIPPSSITELERQALERIDAGSFELANRMMDEYPGQGVAENRLRGFLRSQIALRLGEFGSSIRAIHETEARFGSHISLLTNLACCYYGAGQFIEWQATVARASRVYDEVKSKISADRRAMTVILLAQFFEECGKISQALDMYEDLLKTLDPVGDGVFYYKTVVQLLRLTSAFQLKTGAGRFYPLLTRLQKDDANRFRSVEVQHCLILAELCLFGPEAARARRDEFLARPNLRNYDRRTVLFDFEESYFFLEGRKSGSLPDFSSCAAELDAYEREFCALLYDGDRGSMNAENSDSDSLPLARQLTLQALRRCLHPRSEFRLESVRKLKFLLGTLSARDKKLWQRRLGDGPSRRPSSASSDAFAPRDLQGAKEKKSILRLGNRQIHWGEHILNFGKKAQLWNLLEALLQQSQWSHSDIVKVLWDPKDPHSPLYYHRLRNLVYRLNGMVEQTFGKKICVVMDGKFISVSADIELQTA